MAEIKSPEFQRLLMEMFFQGKPAPAAMFVGLCRDTFAVTPTIASLEASEPQATEGYMRQPVLRGSWHVAADPTRAQHDGVGFTNTGEGRWPPLRTWFLVAEDQGQQVLVDWGQLRETRILITGDRLIVPLVAKWPE